MRCLLTFLLALFIVPTAFAGDPLAHRVLIISIDGLRPDLLLRSKTPILQGLMDQGSYTMWAQTTAVSVTLPSHVSMLTGVRPQIHQIEWNHDIPLSETVYPKVPTIFELAHHAGYSTGIIAGKSKFDCLAKPGTVDLLRIPTKEYVPDDTVRDWAIDAIHSGLPKVVFIHLPIVDVTGHAKGWGSIEQRQAIARADEIIGQILDAIDQQHYPEPMLTIISADHGGAGLTHGADDPRSRHIPWIAFGPGVRKNLDLTTYADLTVRTEDTFATACDWLKIPLPTNLDGKPVKLIYDRAGEELLSSNPDK